MKIFRSFAPAIAALVAFTGLAAGADIIWRTLPIRSIPGVSIEVPDYLKERPGEEKTGKEVQVQTPIAAEGIDGMGGQLLCVLSRQPLRRMSGT